MTVLTFSFLSKSVSFVQVRMAFINATNSVLDQILEFALNLLAIELHENFP